MSKTIRPDGSLDPAADFEDDGASFRVRRNFYVRRQNRGQALREGALSVVWLIAIVASIFIGIGLGGLICCFIGL